MRQAVEVMFQISSKKRNTHSNKVLLTQGYLFYKKRGKTQIGQIYDTALYPKQNQSNAELDSSIKRWGKIAPYLSLLKNELKSTGLQFKLIFAQ